MCNVLKKEVKTKELEDICITFHWIIKSDI